MPLRQRIPSSLHAPIRGAYQLASRRTSSLRAMPDFLVIGGQRCGTTSLFKNLAEHPQVLRPAIEKGTDYYTLHYSQGVDWYRANFPLTALSTLRTRRLGPPQVFEACTYYMFHPFAMERIAKDLPDVKLVAMLRNPVERAFSAYKHEFARGFETVADFEEALELEDSRLEGEIERMAADVDYESHAHRHHAYRRRGQFADQIQRVLDFFPKEQLLVCESENYFARPEVEYARIRDFLGLADFEPAQFDRFNARPSKPMPVGAQRRLEEHYKEHDGALAEILGHRPAWSA